MFRHIELTEIEGGSGDLQSSSKMVAITLAFIHPRSEKGALRRLSDSRSIMHL
jgi:hypothetical protein